jgi:tetratricopeptide (TPR) repeat protein
VFWVHASDTARLEQSFRDIADQVKMRGRKDPQVDVFELLHDWLRDKKNGPWLLVIDDADDAAVLARLTDNNQSPAAKSSINGDNGGNILQQHLSRILPQSRHGSVLVTSRSKHVALKIVEDSEIMTVEPMQDAAAIELLCKKLGVQSSSDEEITELARVLDHMPLALVQAATYIRERAPRISVRQYLIGYQANDRTKISLLNKEAGHLRRDRAASNSVLMTWQLSFDHIKRVQNSAAELLSLMSFYDHQGIQESLLRSYSGAALKRKSEGIRKEDDRFEKDILTLRNYSFITVTEDPFTFEMPSLVQLATRKWLDNQGQLDYWRKQFIHNLCAELPTGEYENWTKCQALFPHARAALAQRPNNKDSLLEWALLLYKAAWYAWQRGRADDAEHMSTVSMEVRRKILGEEDAETLKSIEMVGQARFLRGKYEEAEGIVMHTLAQREKVLGREHPDTLASMNNLALVLDSQGKYKEAEEMMRQSWIRREKELGPTHPDTMTSRSNLAAVLDRQGNHKEAEAMNRATLLWLEKLLGPEHPSTLRAMGSLARGLNNQGKYNEAEEMMMQTLALVERVFEPEHPLTLEIVNSLEQVRLGQRLYEEAQKLKQRELEGCEELGPKQTEQTQIGSAGDSDLAQEDLLAMQNKRVGIEEINDNTQVPQFPPMEQHGENHIGATGDDSPSRQSFLAEQYKLSHTISSSLSRAFETSEKIFSSTGRDVQTVTEHTEHSQRGPSIPGYQSANSDEQTVPTGLYAAPTRYAPSEIDSQPGPKDRNCITELAAALFSKMTTSDVDIKTLQRISQLLPDLLRTFALKVGYQGPTQMHRDVMHFVYKYRM